MHSSYNYSDFIDLVPRTAGIAPETGHAETDTLAADPGAANIQAAAPPTPVHSKGKYSKG